MADIVGKDGCCVLLALALITGQAAGEDRREKPTAENLLPPAALEEYRSKLKAYLAARQNFDQEARAYWTSVAEKKAVRNEKRRKKLALLLDDYVLTQPPVYRGPAKPIDPAAAELPPPAPKYIPVIGDFLASAEAYFHFTPRRPQSELEFKQAYASVARAAGLTKDQIVRIYGFEAGGNASYDVQAGLESRAAGARAISTALGYNQLLATNSLELLAEKGDRFIAQLRRQAEARNEEALERKIVIIREMVRFARTVRPTWSEHEKLARTPKGLGLHALNLDVDVGPLLQTQKLLDSVNFARNKGHQETLTAAELELMNLTGDSTGLDMVLMPADMRDQVPTANFFQPAGYARNPVAARNNTVAKLMAAINVRMDKEVLLPGAKELARAFELR